MKTVLVADDNAVSRELIREVLDNIDCEVLEACDGREALEKIRETRPDLVLLDIQMPFLDGYTVLEQIRKDPGFTILRVVALTAYAMQGDREKALAAGFDGYITKPIQIAELRSRLRELLS